MKTLLAVLAFSINAQALDLVDGNKIVDAVTDKYQMTLSQKFISVNRTSADRIQLIGNPNFNSGALTDLAPIVGYATRFSAAYPELVEKDVDRLRQTFSDIREIVLDDCKLGFIGVNATTVYGIATWGKGHGVTLVMPFNNEMESAVRESLENIVLDPDACGWE